MFAIKPTKLLLLLSWAVIIVNAVPHTKRQDSEPSSPPTAGSAHDLFLRKLLHQSPHYGDFSGYNSSDARKPFKVGIVGAGATGLYSAILLESLGIDYEVLEADTRIGGRIYTYRFDEEKWSQSRPGEPDYYNYYDVGAMRFPTMAWMDRVIGKQNTSIVSYVNAKVSSPADMITMIPYYFQANNTFRLYNDKLVYNQVIPSADTFGILTTEGGVIDNLAFAAMSPFAVLDDAVKELMDAMTEDFDMGFQKLMEYDQISVRQYLLQRGYTSPEVDWLETINDATEHYDTMSLSQAAIETWIFDESPLDTWQCVEGGMDRITNGMAKILRNPVLTSKRVTRLKSGADGEVDVVINDVEERSYSHVINTPPLGVIATMDMTELNLDYAKKLAIRKLTYDSAGKIGMTFKSRWWQDLDESFVGGQSYTDLPIRRAVYPSYGVTTPDAAAAMIASYTWGQDSARLGAYYGTYDSDAYIVSSTLRELAQLHNVTYEFLQEQLVDYHLWNWYGHEFSVGAFASFTPAQFSTIMPPLLQPAYFGKVHFAGEALSSGHGWIIGALNSAYRAVAEILAVEGMETRLTELVDTWGEVDEVDMGWYSTIQSK